LAVSSKAGAAIDDDRSRGMIKRETVPGAGTDAQERKGVAVVKDGGSR
jgi:hypothetical protein